MTETLFTYNNKTYKIEVDVITWYNTNYPVVLPSGKCLFVSSWTNTYPPKIKGFVESVELERNKDEYYKAVLLLD